MAKLKPLYWIDEKTNKLRYSLHHGQRRAILSRKRIVAMIAGTQGGKTSFGPLWLLREMQAMGQGDYLVATPTFKLLKLRRSRSS